MKKDIFNKIIIGYFCIFLAIFYTIPSFAEEIDYKSLIQKSYLNQASIFQKNSYQLTSSNDFIPESDEPLKNYILNVGDTLQFNLLSRDVRIDYIFTINPEGKFFIPKIGEIYASNLTIDQLKTKIKDKISGKIKDFELSILLLKVRNIKVFLTGYVNRPGSYTIPYFTRLFDFIKIAEGVNDLGSIRNIEIADTNHIKNAYDLYNFIYKGKLSNNPILKSGDFIYVPEISKKVVLIGNVIKPGLYEFKDKDDLNEIYKNAGVFFSLNDTNKVIIWKKGIFNLSSGEGEISIKDLKNDFSVNDGDIIFVPYVKQPQDTSIVYVYGQVLKPGSLPYKEGLKASDYLKASGVNSLADMEKIKITRIRNNKSTVFIIDANEIIFNGNTEKDIFIEPNDVIFIPEKFFNFKNFNDITSVLLSTLGIVSLVLSFTRK